MKILNKITNKYVLLCEILISLSLISFFVYAIYTRPMVDDFWYSIITHNYLEENGYTFINLIKSAIETDIYFFNNWNGAFISPFIAAIQPGLFGGEYYFIGAYLLLILVFVVLYYFFNTINKYVLNNAINALFCTFIFFAFYMHSTPDISQVIFWYMGAWAYTLYLLLVLINVSIIIKYFIYDENKYLILSCIISFIIPGGNSMFGFLNILLLMAISSYFFYKGKNKRIVCALLFAIIGFILVLVLPGASARLTVYNRAGFFETIFASIIKFYEIFCAWFDVRLFCFYLLIIVVFSKIFDTNLKVSINPFIIIFISLIIMLGLLCMPYYAMGTFGKGRIENVIWIVFIFLSSFIIIYTILFMKQKEYMDFGLDLNNNYLISILSIVLCFLMCYSYTNGNNLIHEISNKSIQKFAEEWDYRDIQIKNSNDDIVYVNELPECEYHTSIGDIKEDTEYWANEVLFQYYKKKIISK